MWLKERKDIIDEHIQPNAISKLMHTNDCFYEYELRADFIVTMYLHLTINYHMRFLIRYH